jgi:hypothetical protein
MADNDNDRDVALRPAHNYPSYEREEGPYRGVTRRGCTRAHTHAQNNTTSMDVCVCVCAAALSSLAVTFVSRCEKSIFLLTLHGIFEQNSFRDLYKSTHS